MIITFITGIILVTLLTLAVTSFSTNKENNTTTEINVTINNSNNTTNETPQTTSKNTKQNKKKSQSEDGIYYDEELNLYFDKNDRTVYDGQVEKGTSKSDLKKMSDEIVRETNGY